MTPQEWALCVVALRSAYSHSFKLDSAAIDYWFSRLQDLPGEAVANAINYMAENQSAFPSIADIRKLAATRAPEPIEAWHEALKASRDSGVPEHRVYRPAPRQVETQGGYVRGGEKSYGYAEHQWSSPAVAKAVESIGGLRAIKGASERQVDVLRAQFLKAYAAFAASETRKVVTSGPPLKVLPGGVDRAGAAIRQLSDKMGGVE